MPFKGAFPLSSSLSLLKPGNYELGFLSDLRFLAPLPWRVRLLPQGRSPHALARSETVTFKTQSKRFLSLQAFPVPSFPEAGLYATPL